MRSLEERSRGLLPRLTGTSTVLCVGTTVPRRGHLRLREKRRQQEGQKKQTHKSTALGVLARLCSTITSPYFQTHRGHPTLRSLCAASSHQELTKRNKLHFSREAGKGFTIWVSAPRLGNATGMESRRPAYPEMREGGQATPASRDSGEQKKKRGLNDFTVVRVNYCCTVASGQPQKDTLFLRKYLTPRPGANTKNN